MRKIILFAALLLTACNSAPSPDPAPEPDLYPELPRAERMQQKGITLPPPQAKEFCAENKEFAKC